MAWKSKSDVCKTCAIMTHDTGLMLHDMKQCYRMHALLGGLIERIR